MSGVRVSHRPPFLSLHIHLQYKAPFVFTKAHGYGTLMNRGLFSLPSVVKARCLQCHQDRDVFRLWRLLIGLLAKDAILIMECAQETTRDWQQPRSDCFLIPSTFAIQRLNECSSRQAEEKAHISHNHKAGKSTMLSLGCTDNGHPEYSKRTDIVPLER